MTVTVVDHPLVVDALARIRDASTPNGVFRDHMERMGLLLLAEATRELPLRATSVTTPLETTDARRLATQPVIVPILRAGLGFLPPAQSLLPDADVGFVGISRDEATFSPKPYVNRLPERLEGRPVIVVDPMLATGGSAIAALRRLEQAGAADCRLVCLVAAPEGVRRVREAMPRLPPIVVAALDRRLDEKGYIRPGLGDAGDRLFGTE